MVERTRFPTFDSSLTRIGERFNSTIELFENRKQIDVISKRSRPST